MGFNRYDDDDMKSFTTSTTKGKSREEIFSSRLDQYLDPHGITIRESRDSDNHPNSTPLIFGLDVTGSMGIIAENMARDGLRELMNGLYEKNPVTDPQAMFMAIGDVERDACPLQVSQFETDILIAEQLQKIYLEGGGGGNDCESYTLPWWFAVNKIVTDAWEKRKKKGYIFTIGDEPPNDTLPAKKTKSKTGLEISEDICTENLLAQVEEKWIPFHIMVAQGDYMSNRSNGRKRVQDSWKKLLGDRAITLEDSTKLASTIIEAIERHEAGIEPPKTHIKLRS